MRKLIVAIMASSALAMAIPVVAQAHNENEAAASADEDWNNGGGTYANFDQEYHHIWDGIQHGLSDGSYTRREAYRFYREMRYIHARADWQERSGNYDPEDIQARLESLHERMHIAHERGHERLDQYGGYGNDWRGGNNNGYRDQNGNPYGR